MDFFTVPTLTFGVLYCFFVIVQQLREAWPYAQAQKFLLFDRDAKFGNDVITAIKNLGTQPVRTAFRSPWQNGVAERWVESCRRDLLDHVIVLNERHLKRLMHEYIRYYHEGRTDLGLAKDTPQGRPIARDSAYRCRIQAFPRLDGLASSLCLRSLGALLPPYKRDSRLQALIPTRDEMRLRIDHYLATSGVTMTGGVRRSPIRRRF